MCGIAGFIDFQNTLSELTLEKMVQSLHHRGPDGSGTARIDLTDSRIGIGHTRLSILDLSSAGHQPMKFADWIITYNGEVYNFLEIRNELKQLGHTFVTETDTEVILHAFSRWKEKAVEKFIGMFAFFIVDTKNQQCFLIRDRSGIKPLYFYQGEGFYLFASELKALHAVPQFKAQLELSSVRQFFEYGFIKGSHSIFKNCRKIKPSEILRIDLKTRTVCSRFYWDPVEICHQPKRAICYEDAVDELDDLLTSAVNFRMVADVPVGVFLSGGYDSTVVAAILQKHRTAPIKTFTIGFEGGNNEAPFAQQTAAKLGTEHHELYCSSAYAKELVPQLCHIFDEPFGDSSAIPTVLVSRFARESVKVAISADGGDETFGGYNSYLELAARLKRIEILPQFLQNYLRRYSGQVMKFLPKRPIRKMHLIKTIVSSISEEGNLTGQKLHQNAARLPAYYLDRMFCKSDSVLLGLDNMVVFPHLTALEGAMLIDYTGYLPDDILVKVDRATMSAGLEGREALLDHRLFEFAATLPQEFKNNGAIGKRILRSVVSRYVSPEMMNRRKTGFSVPLGSWLRNELKEMLNTHCSADMLSEVPFFDQRFLRKQVDMFQSGQFYYTTLIWRLLVFMLWFKCWKPRV